MWRCSLELQVACDGHAERPATWEDILEHESLPICDGDPEGERLAREIRQGVPVRAPVVRHGDPIRRTVALDVHGFNVAGAGDIGHEHKVEVVEATHGEAQATSFDARNSTTCMIFDNYSNKLNIYIHMPKLLEGLWLQMHPRNFSEISAN
jgi:hypothetical protein